MTQTTSPTPTRQDAPPRRTMRLWLDLWDDRGQLARYSCLPWQEPGTPEAYRLAKFERQDDLRWTSTGDTYTVRLSASAELTCTCPGFQTHRHCKHCDALTAAGLVRRELALKLRHLLLECENRAADLERQLARARAAEADAVRVAQSGTPDDPSYVITTPAQASAAAAALAAYRASKPKRTRRPRKPVAA